MRPLTLRRFVALALALAALAPASPALAGRPTRASGRGIGAALPAGTSARASRGRRPADVSSPARARRGPTIGAARRKPAVTLAHGSAGPSGRSLSWLPAGRQTALAHLLAHVSPTGARRGAVVAAPDGNPEYQDHWTRDAAIVMAEIMSEVEAGPSALRPVHLRLLKDYVRFSWRTIKTKSQAGLGEPKYRLSGRAFDRPWGRPQNDGPALRALTAMRLATWGMRNGEASYVRATLYNRERSLITADLDYVADRWRDPSYDVWEEEKAHHLFVRLVHHDALFRGAALARSLDDGAAARRYVAAAQDVKDTIAGFWDPERGILRASWPGQDHAGIDYKTSGLDTGVIIAVLRTAGPSGALRAADERVLSTATRLEEAFRREYPINHGRRGAVAIGRYPEDRYGGQPGQDRPGGGNPWIITTNAFAELHYRVAAELGDEPRVIVTRYNRPFFLAALGDAAGREGERLPEGEIVEAGSPMMGRLRDAILTRGDDYLALVHEVVERSGGVQREQIHRAEGLTVGAEDLTWNHASFLSAARARRAALAGRANDAR